MSSNDGDSRDQGLRFSRRAFTRTFVHMDKRLKAAPNKREFEKLKKAGRVREMAFTKNHTAGDIEQLLLSHFPTLVGLDLSRLRFISSYDRGHAMSVVFRGVPDGEEIMQNFGGDAKKKVFMYWKPGSSSSNPPANVSLSAACGSSALLATAPSLTSPPSSVTSSSLSSTTTSLTVPSSSSTSASSSSSLTSSPATTSLTFTSSTATTLSTATTSSAASALSSSGHTNTVTITSTPVATPAVQSSLPRNGQEARRYLTALAQNNNTDGIALTIGDYNDDDLELLRSPFNDVIIVDPIPQVRGHRARQIPPTTTSTSTRVNSSVTTQPLNSVTCTQSTGFYGTPFYGDGLRAGTVIEDFSPNGLGGTSTFESRTHEVSRCQSLFGTSCTDGTMPLPFMNHSFEEICWQACESKRAIIAVLLNPSHQGQFREDMTRLLHQVRTECSHEDWFFWIAETCSADGQKVLKLYGNGQEDQIIFLAPATQMKPVFIERIDGAGLQDFDTNRLYERVKVMIEGLTLERDQLALTRQLRSAQEKELHETIKQDNSNIQDQNGCQQQQHQLMQDNNINDHNDAHQPQQELMQDNNEIPEDENEEEKIRKQRSQRLTNEPANGVTVILCHNNGNRLRRRFDSGALFQEVYDWAGTLKEVPLYFTLHREGKLVLHGHKVEANSVLHMTERGKEEAASLLASEVSFKGNYCLEEDLSDTVNDGSQQDEEVLVAQQQVQETVQQPVQEMQETVQQPVQEVQQPMQQPVQEMQQPMQQPVQEMQQPMQQPVQEVQQPVQEAQQPAQGVQQPVQQPAQGMQQPVREVQQPAQGVQQPMQEVQQHDHEEPHCEGQEKRKRKKKDKRKNKLRKKGKKDMDGVGL